MIYLKDGRRYDNRTLEMDAYDLALLSDILARKAASNKITDEQASKIMDRKLNEFWEKSYFITEQN